MKKPKFRVGQVVFLVPEDEPFKIRRRLHDPSDGWEYSNEDLGIRLTFEEDLRPLTAREIGPRKPGKRKKEKQ